jgi:hypothetical protein
MGRASAAVVVLIASLAATYAPWGSSPAHACSISPFSEQSLLPAIGEAQVVAVGTLRDATRDEIQFEIEEAMKGADPGDVLPIRNQPVQLFANCDLYFDPNHPGFYYPEGERVLMLLVQDDTDGRWHPEYFGNAWFAIDGDGLYWHSDDTPSPPLAEIRAAVSASPGGTVEPDDEIACSLVFGAITHELPATIDRSELIVVGELWGATGGTMKVRVHEYLKGSGPADLTFSSRWISPREVLDRSDPMNPTATGDCYAAMEDGQHPWLRGGQRILLFLRPDEFGIADWRPSMQGQAVYVLSADRPSRPPGLPTLSDVRDEAEKVTGQPARRIAVSPSPTPQDEPGAARPGDDSLPGDDNGDWAVAIGGLILAFFLGAGVVIADLKLRSRRQQGQ